MLKGAALFFTYLITISCGTKKLTNVQHFWMISIVFSLSTIGYSNLSSPHMRCKILNKYRSSQPFTGKFFNNTISIHICINVYCIIKNNKILQHPGINCCLVVRSMGYADFSCIPIFIYTIQNINNTMRCIPILFTNIKK
jgi:hypothetical protein